jgi:hypothetical protein
MRMLVIVPMATCLSLLALSACAVEGRLSGIVAFEYGEKWKPVADFLQKPGLSFVEAYVQFADDLGEGVIFGVDQELTEGVNSPIWVSQGDWMALVGLQRTGKVWVATGTPDTMAGKPSKDRNWVFLSLGQPLQANTWYRLKCIADFSVRKFVSFTIEGPNLNKTLDLSQYTLDYPNALPFDMRAMTYYVWSMYGKVLGGKPEDNARVYFDDVRHGLVTNEPGPDGKPSPVEKPMGSSDFESETGPFPAQPLDMADIMKTKTIKQKAYAEEKWYLERDTAMCRAMQAPFARSGKMVVECDATVQDINYKQWLDSRGK